MPEGDTIHKLARAMHERLAGGVVRDASVRHRGRVDVLVGGRVDEVVALGKHMLIGVSGSWVMHLHLGMYGRMRYSGPEVEPTGTPSARLATDAHSYTLRRAAIAEVMRRVEVATHPRLTQLGPDLLAARFDLPAAVKRARARGGRLADALLDQSVACGLGNVYKSEILFIERLHPFAEIADLSDARLAGVYRTARRLMRQNVGGGRRTTVREVTVRAPLRPGEIRLFVYGRRGHACLKCRGEIQRLYQGDLARATFWCPRCQS